MIVEIYIYKILMFILLSKTLRFPEGALRQNLDIREVAKIFAAVTHPTVMGQYGGRSHFEKQLWLPTSAHP